MPRQQRGELNNGAKITSGVVARTKGLFASGHSQADIARLLGLTRANVWAVVHGKSWDHITPTEEAAPSAPAPRIVKCSRCKIVLNGIHRRRTGTYCRPCKSIVCRENGRAVRLRAIERLGGKCVCCGESRFEFLAFDHVNGGGNAHRKVVSTRKLAGMLARGNIEGFQLLCHNCNLAKGFYGQCPHENERQRPIVLADFARG